jgi:hypothetical protein
MLLLQVIIKNAQFKSDGTMALVITIIIVLDFIYRL